MTTIPSPAVLAAWQARHGLSDYRVAAVLGIGRSSWIYWRTGGRPIARWLSGLLYAYDHGWRADDTVGVALGRKDV